MIKRIKQHYLLSQCIKPECCENNVKAIISDTITDENYVILDIDEYYRLIKRSNRGFKLPPSIDCLILIKCSDGDYKLFIIELKNLTSNYNIQKGKIYRKFKTTISDFLKNRYPSTFSFENNLKEFDLFLVTNLDHYSDNDTLSKRLNDPRLNFLNTIKPFEYNGFTRTIKAGLPNSVIQNC